MWNISRIFLLCGEMKHAKRTESLDDAYHKFLLDSILLHSQHVLAKKCFNYTLVASLRIL